MKNQVSTNELIEDHQVSKVKPEAYIQEHSSGVKSSLQENEDAEAVSEYHSDKS